MRTCYLLIGLLLHSGCSMISPDSPDDDALEEMEARCQRDCDGDDGGGGGDDGGDGGGGGPIEPSGPPMNRAMISFQTNDENKDFDTQVTVTVRDANGVTVATLSGAFGEFPDSTRSVTYPLQTLNGSALNLLQGGTVNLHVQPVGNDTWRFGFFLNILLTDGSRLAVGTNSMSLSESHQDQMFSIAQVGKLTPGAPADGSIMTSGAAYFATTNDNKDDDTIWRIVVRDENGAPIATLTGSGEEFEDNTTKGPFFLALQQSNVSRGTVQRGSVELHSNPVGNDTWRFTFALDIFFSDGTIVPCRFTNIELTESRPWWVATCL
jgi:hypothetical protein